MTSKPVNSGFTLVETLIAVLLLATAITGPLTIASKSLLAALVAKDQITAFFLAQDAVEFVRFARDTNKLQGATDWLTGAGASQGGVSLSNCLTTVNADGCYFDSGMINPASPGACTAATCGTPIGSGSSYLYEDQGRYWYDSGDTKTPFVRQITISSIDTDEVLLTVVVRWRDAIREHSVTVQENLFDWQ